MPCAMGNSKHVQGLVAFGLSRPRLPRKLRRRRPARAPSRLQHVFDALADKHGVCRLDTTGESETTRMRANRRTVAAGPPASRAIHLSGGDWEGGLLPCKRFSGWVVGFLIVEEKHYARGEARGAETECAAPQPTSPLLATRRAAWRTIT